MNFSETSHEIIIFPYEISISFMARRRSRGKDIARPVEHQLGIGQSCRFTGANSWFHGIQGRFWGSSTVKTKVELFFWANEWLNYVELSKYIYISKISMKNKNHCSWVEIFCGFIWKWLGLSERYLGLWSQALLFGNGVYSSIPTYFELNFLNYSHSCPRIKNPSLINWGGSFQIVMICDLLLKWYPENRHLGMT